MDYYGKLERHDLIIRNFDEVIQTKSSKITVEQLQKKVEKNFVDRTELNEFLQKAAEASKQQEEKEIIHKLMIEEL